MAIEGIFIRQPSDVFFNIDSTLQRWRVLLRKSDQTTFDGWRFQAQGWCGEFLKQVRERPQDLEQELRRLSSLFLAFFWIYSSLFREFLSRCNTRTELETWELQVRAWMGSFREKIRDRPPDQNVSPDQDVSLSSLFFFCLL